MFYKHSTWVPRWNGEHVEYTWYVCDGFWSFPRTLKSGSLSLKYFVERFPLVNEKSSIFDVITYLPL